MSVDPGFIVGLAILYASGIPHEIAHGTVALWCGDSTAQRSGRLSWNPAVHFDLMWTLIIPLVMYVSTGFYLGGLKPVPVVPWYLRNPKRDYMLVSFAGPLTNLAIALVFTLFAAIPGIVPMDSWNQWIFVRIVWINLMLFCFNMLPVPPLDGFGVIRGLLPRALDEVADAVAAGGFMVLLLALYAGLDKALMIPMLKLFNHLVVMANQGLAFQYMFTR